ncbi:hypothetical protein RO04_09385 [Aggregatibacter actinomycetemcomitans]|uniref:zf-HC2 domain-containing protein n=1 Tax=Aggregatibacter actinomycetemcomitans TaxID=714 RepID=UPI0005188E79|nr:zf-HC2 domain-containing protein [Aggregatibacter actinomycetemcomitans]KOE70196.1 hypothetical protein D18P1_0304860 [Aggregatibacter actinomycetemcomitans serotype f str. D18P1]KYK89255.1 dsDNA-mimic protein [Aggregatibacter actinomycetemcomitans serotype f str. SC29R]MBN6061296.1 zf-HC2 domain-containing protein [Aggregatibacter actinomycetemcomitans]OZV15355.1 hypothetical protein RO04_09385 [Aggregatibacter actinomycetemcomitans]UEL53778.1 zf-HC2 domain-containing protein [Aggregatibac
MKCKQVTKLISDGQEKPLSLLQHSQVYIHLAICPYCRAFARNCAKMHDMMHEFAEQPDNEKVR